MVRRCFAPLVALTLLGAAEPQDPAALFGVRESIHDIRLSPDGAKIAYVAPAPQGQGASLYTVDLATGRTQLTTAVDGRSQRLDTCNWVSNARLVCNVYAVRSVVGEPVGASRLVALDTDGKNVKPLGERESLYQRFSALYGGGVIDWLPGEDGAVLMQRYFVPEQRPGTNLARTENGFGVVRVDTRTLGIKKVVDPKLNAVEYISDGRGNVRIMGIQPPRGATGQASSHVNYSYRASGSGEWRPFGKYDASTREGLNPFAVDPTLDAAYAFEKLNGRSALYRVALDGSGRKELIFAHDQVDIDELVTLGRARRVVGVSYATDFRRVVYFDPVLKTLAESLSKALPGLPIIRFAGASDDEGKLLIWAGRDTDPGRYYLYDKGSRKLEEVMLSRPQLEGIKLAAVKPVAYRAADGTMVPGYLTLPPGSSGKGLPGIVMPHGGPGARDEWGFDWLAQYYAHRGYAVLQPNFRGSAGYGDAWFQENGFQSWQVAIGDVNDAGRWLVAEGIADPAKLAIVGWSYGGYAALQSNVLDSNLFKAVVAIAPVTDLNLLKEESCGWTDFATVRDFIGSGPHVRAGSPAQNAGAIHAPVLLFHGELDRNVGVGQSRLMRDRLNDAGRKVELVLYPGLDHNLDDTMARTEMLRRSDAFLRAALGLK